MNQPPGWGPQQGQGYGPPPSPHGYPQPPPKKGLSGLAIAAIVVGGIVVLGFGSCVVCVGLAAHGVNSVASAVASASAAASATTAAECDGYVNEIHDTSKTFTNNDEAMKYLDDTIAKLEKARQACAAAGRTDDADRFQRAKRDVQKQRTQTIDTAAAAIAKKVTAMKLFADYHANEVVADEAYKDKILRVTGTITDIKKDFTGSMIVNLATSNQLEPVRAHMDESEKANAKFYTKGTSATLICVGGGMIIGDPVLKACKLATD